MQRVLRSSRFMTCPCRHRSWEAILWFNAGIFWSWCPSCKHFHPNGGFVRGGVQRQSLQHPGAHLSPQQLKVLHTTSAFHRPQRAAEGKLSICTLQTSQIAKLYPLYPHPNRETWGRRSSVFTWPLAWWSCQSSLRFPIRLMSSLKWLMSVCNSTICGADWPSLLSQHWATVCSFALHLWWLRRGELLHPCEIWNPRLKLCNHRGETNTHTWFG